ncbi:hypothetical protein AB0D59_05405 [Streptomyces sp. NPDC048417]|uniref:hypothetical protein n=1 Tax=Streptomyces sp. NPDC048417 TaxID=3155387 RepID=UPI003446382B
MPQDEKTTDVIKPLDNHASIIEEDLLDASKAAATVTVQPSEDDEKITTLDNHASSEPATAVLLDNHASGESA